MSFPEHLMFIFFPHYFYLFFHNIPLLLFSVFLLFSWTISSSLFPPMYMLLENFLALIDLIYTFFSHSWIPLGCVFLCLHSHIRERYFGRSHLVPSWPLYRKRVKTSGVSIFLLFLQACFWIMPDRHVGILQGPGHGQVLLPKNLIDTWRCQVSSQTS